MVHSAPSLFATRSAEELRPLQKSLRSEGRRRSDSPSLLGDADRCMVSEGRAPQASTRFWPLPAGELLLGITFFDICDPPDIAVAIGHRHVDGHHRGNDMQPRAGCQSMSRLPTATAMYARWSHPCRW
jgi:hypothetical protein